MPDKVTIFTRVDSNKPIKTSLASLVLQKHPNKKVCIINVDDATLNKFKTKEVKLSNPAVEVWKSSFNNTEILMFKFKISVKEHQQNNIAIDITKEDTDFYVFSPESFDLEDTFCDNVIKALNKHKPHIGLVYGDIVMQDIKQYLPPFDRANMMPDYGPYAIPKEVITEIKFTEGSIVDKITQKFLGYHEPAMVSKVR